MHKECCARVDGNRQTFSIHPCSFSDSIFVPLPIPKEQGDTRKKVCSTCNNPGQEVINSLLLQVTCETLYFLLITQGTLLASSKPCLPKDWVNLLNHTALFTDWIWHDQQQDLSHLQGHPSVDIVNGLNIKGELVSAFRGKKLVLGIGKVCPIVIHCLWILKLPSSVSFTSVLFARETPTLDSHSNLQWYCLLSTS